MVKAQSKHASEEDQRTANKELTVSRGLHRHANADGPEQSAKAFGSRQYADGKCTEAKVSRPITGRMFPKGKPNALTMTVIIKTLRTIGSLRAYRRPFNEVSQHFRAVPAGRVCR